MLLLSLFIAGCSTAPPEAIKQPEARAVAFLVREVPAWARENNCYSCHNNGDGARALYLALSRGYRVPQRALNDTTGWLSQPAQWDHNRGDPGFSDKRLANLQFANSLLAAAEAGQLKEPNALPEAAHKLVADQDADGSWPIDRQNSAGSPATYGTTLATYLAWRTLLRSGRTEDQTALQKAAAWLQRATPEHDNIPALSALLLTAAVQRDTNSLAARKYLQTLREAQNGDGGWGPYRSLPSEPFDTALALLALVEWANEDGVPQLIQRGRNFLFARQNSDGSWPATTRPPDGQSYAQSISTTSWALLALLATQEATK